jgi:hypothetical protein
MQFRKNPDRPIASSGTRPAGQHRWQRIFVCIVIMVTFAAQPGSESTRQSIERPYLLPEVSAQREMPERQTKQQDYETANAERKKQLAEDSARLLKLATDLKAEVDKTNKDILSLNVVRKANEIERLARNMKEKMKLAVGTD